MDLVLQLSDNVTLGFGTHVLASFLIGPAKEIEN